MCLLVLKLADNLLGVSLNRIAEHNKPQQPQGPGTGLYVCLRRMHQICVCHRRNDSHGQCHEAKAVATVGAHHLHEQQKKFRAGEGCSTKHCCVQEDSIMYELSTCEQYWQALYQLRGPDRLCCKQHLVNAMQKSPDAATSQRNKLTCAVSAYSLKLGRARRKVHQYECAYSGFAIEDMRTVIHLLEIRWHRASFHHALDDIRSALQEEQGCPRRPSIRQHHSPRPHGVRLEVEHPQEAQLGAVGL